MMELMSLLIRHHAWELLLVLAAAPASRFCFRALEPAPRRERPRQVGTVVVGSGNQGEVGLMWQREREIDIIYI